MRFNGKIDIELYRVIVRIFFADNADQWAEDVQRVMRTTYDIDESADAKFIFNPTTRALAIMLRPSRTLLPNLVHECYHAAFCILDDVGMKHCFQSEEAYTYLATYIFEKATVILQKNEALPCLSTGQKKSGKTLPPSRG